MSPPPPNLEVPAGDDKSLVFLKYFISFFFPSHSHLLFLHNLFPSSIYLRVFLVHFLSCFILLDRKTVVKAHMQ